MAGPLGRCNDNLIREGFASGVPVIFSQDCLAYLCHVAQTICRKLGIEVGEPPENPGADWIAESWEAYCTDPDKVEVSAEERFKSFLSSIGEVNLGGP